MTTQPHECGDDGKLKPARPGIVMTCPRCRSGFRALDGHTIHPYCARCMSIIHPGWGKPETQQPE